MSVGDRMIPIGSVSAVHGLRGELRVMLYNSESETLKNADNVTIGNNEYVVNHTRYTAKGWLLLLEGISDRNTAETLCGQEIVVARDLIELKDGEYLLIDLVGCEVSTIHGSPYGVVESIEVSQEEISQDRLVIRDGDVRRWMPLVSMFLVHVDIDAQKIIIDPPDGLPQETLTL